MLGGLSLALFVVATLSTFMVLANREGYVFSKILSLSNMLTAPISVIWVLWVSSRPNISIDFKMFVTTTNFKVLVAIYVILSVVYAIISYYPWRKPHKLVCK